MIMSDVDIPCAARFAEGRTFLRPGRRAFIFLSLIPIADSAVNQLQTAFAVSIGPLSMLQALRGGLTVVMTVMVLKYFYAIRARAPLDLVVVTLSLYALFAYACKEVIVTGSVEMENVIHYAQMVYWLEVWLLAVAAFDTPHRRNVALLCILTAALIACASVIFGYFTGARLTYADQGIAASAGLFNTGKGIAGVLVVSGTVHVDDLRNRADSLGTAIACFLFAGAFLTYARAGMVALIGALCALLVWAFAICRDTTTTRWAKRLFLWCLLAGVIGFVTIGIGDLTARWADITDPDQAGSGRVVFWKIALSAFWDGNFSEMVLGRGYSGMCAAIESGYGMRIHTHNDFLDMLVMGGLLGIVCLLTIWLALIMRLRSVNVASPAYGAGLAILVGFLAQSALTGQIFDPSTMSVYIVSLVCVTWTDPEEQTLPGTGEEFDEDPPWLACEASSDWR